MKDKAFLEAYERLNERQRAAVDKTDGALLVIAGPGTGKTQLLSTRVANILRQPDTNPENILCLTYTEAGASEMRARLRSLIGPESAKVNISTYHAFGSDIIYLYNAFSEVAGRVLLTPIDPVRQRKILTELRDGLKHNDILRGAKVADLQQTIAELKSARLSAEDVRKVVGANLVDSEEINAAVTGILAEVPARVKFEVVLPFYERVREELTRFVSSEPITGKVERLGNGLLDSLNDVLTEQMAAEKPSTGALTAWRGKYFEKDEQNAWALKNVVANKKLLALANLLSLYDDYLAGRGLFDFADMIEEAIGYLRKNDAFRYSVQERYQYILLDEFQDTNDSQLELIRLVAEEEQPNIMAVGDDDQAIFAFQGARYSNLMDFAAVFAAEVIALNVNYRSGQPIIDLGAAVAEQLSERFADKYGIEKRLQSVASYEGRAEVETFLQRWEFVAEPSEYSQVAGQISELVRGGTAQKEIAVIAPKHKYLEALVPYFAEYPEIRLAYEKRENVLEAESLAPLLKMARMIVALARVRPTAAEMLEVLGFDFWRLPALTVLRTVQDSRAQHRSILSYMEESEDGRLQDLARFFATLAVKSIDTPLEIMLDYLLGTQELDGFRSPYLKHFTDEGGTSAIEFYESLTVLREHAMAYLGKAQLRLRDLVEFADDYEAAEEKLINTSPYSESDDAVRLLSAHSAKGRQFENVFIVALHNRSWGTSKGNNNTLVLPKNLEYVRHTGATEDEKLRLFFVAITRAKQRLWLSSSLKDFAGKELPPLKYLQEAEGISPFLPEGSREIVSVAEVGPAPALMGANWAGKYSVREADVRELAARNVENYRLSATDLTQFLDVVYGGPEEFYLDRVLRRPRAHSAELSYGTIVHMVLDRVSKERVSDEAAVEYYQELVREADFESEVVADILERGTDDLGAFLRARGEYLRGEGHVSELAFSRDNLVAGGVPITGKIDHLEVDEAGKLLRVVDFKTGRWHREKWDSHATLYKYKLQLMFYRLLLSASPRWGGYEVREAVIDFVTPDEGGEVRQKVLEFSEAEMAEFERLCGVVYGKIKALDFPDVSGYEKTLGGMKKFMGDLLGE